MNKLKTIDRSVREIIEKEIALVRFGRDESISKEFGRVGVKGVSDLAEEVDLVERRAQMLEI